MHPERLRQIASLALTLLLLVACGAPLSTPTAIPPTATPTPVPPTPTPTAVSTKDWPLYERPAEGFAINLPPSWQPVDLDPQTLEATFRALGEKNPQAMAMFGEQAQNLIASGFKFFGFEMAPEAAALGFATNVNVLKQPLPVAVSLEVYTQLNVGQLENTPTVVKPVSHQRVKLDGVEAEELRYRISLNSPTGGVATLAVTQYLVVSGKDAYVVTLTTTADLAEKYAPTFERMGQRFRLTK